MSRTMQTQQPDLFAATRADHLPPVVQAEAAKLLSLLLSEAAAKASAPPARSGLEARHDEDLR